MVWEKGKAQSGAELHRMDYFLGIDAGGTKTAAVIVTAIQNLKSKIQNQEIGRGTGGSCGLATGDYPQWTRAIRDAARNACRSADLPDDTRFRGVCAGVAGYSLKAKRGEFAAILAEEISADLYDVTPDYEIAYWGASGGEPGIVVVAGTGSVAFGCNAQGETHKMGGLGYVFGDAGSGFALGKTALGQAIKSLEQARKFPLADAVLARIGAETLEDILEWTYQDFTPAKVAALAPIVGELADAGDETSRRILSIIAQIHSASAALLIRKLALPPDAPVYRLGGLWQISDYLRSLPFPPPSSPEQEREMTQSPRLRLAEPLHDAAAGAALLARHKAK